MEMETGNSDMFQKNAENQFNNLSTALGVNLDIEQTPFYFGENFDNSNSTHNNNTNNNNYTENTPTFLKFEASPIFPNPADNIVDIAMNSSDENKNTQHNTILPEPSPRSPGNSTNILDWLSSMGTDQMPLYNEPEHDHYYNVINSQPSNYFPIDIENLNNDLKDNNTESNNTNTNYYNGNDSNNFNTINSVNLNENVDIHYDNMENSNNEMNPELNTMNHNIKSFSPRDTSSSPHSPPFKKPASKQTPRKERNRNYLWNVTGLKFTPYQQSKNDKFLSNSYMTLVEGFTHPTSRQPGGSDVVKPIMRQVLQLDQSTLHEYDPQQLHVECYVMGYSKTCRAPVSLNNVGVLAQRNFSKDIYDRWIVVFDDIVLKHTSHNNGTRLYLRFDLVHTPSKYLIGSVTSKGFTTITRRGEEKAQLRKKTRGMVSSPEKTIVERCDPSAGILEGGQLVEITGQGFMTTPKDHVTVMFGEHHATRVLCVSPDNIVCKTPAASAPGQVPVHVAFNEPELDLNFLPSKAQYTYYNRNDEEQQKLLLQEGFPGSQHDLGNGSGSGSGSGSSNNNNNNTDNSDMATYSDSGNTSFHGTTGHSNGSWSASIAKMLLNDGVDPRGFSLLSTACAYGYLEMSYYLIVHNGFDVNHRDYYDRTPLYWAITAGDSYLVDMLIYYGANLYSVDCAGYSILHHAVLSGHASIILTMLLRFLAIHSASRESITSLTHAVMKDRCGVDVTPYELAQEIEEQETVNILNYIVSTINNHHLSTSRSTPNFIEISQVVLKGFGDNSFAMDRDHNSLKLLPLFNALVICYQQDGRHFKATLEYKQITTLSIAMEQQRAEFTLNQSPSVQVRNESNNTWENVDEHDGLANLFSFHVEAPKTELERLNRCLEQVTCLFKFRSYCFMYQPQQVTDSAAAMDPTDSDVNELKTVPAINEGETHHNGLRNEASPYQQKTHVGQFFSRLRNIFHSKSNADDIEEVL